jgi:hypothetical protein
MTISAKILCDSINTQGNRFTTFEVEYPRIIHAELLTHRQLSRNCASSRAIPFDKMQQQLTGIPSRFGAAQRGMQDDGREFNNYVSLPIDVEFDEPTDSGLFQIEYEDMNAVSAWKYAENYAVMCSKAFKEAGFHKQIYNRLTEPFQTIKAVISATEWDNWYWLRDDEMADPTIAELARKMKEAYDSSFPQLLKAGEWHLPYVDSRELGCGKEYTIIENSEELFLTLEQAIKVSCARCAAVSYRQEDYGLEKCLELYERLVGSDKLHSSSLEHCATPMNDYEFEWGVSVMNVPNMSGTWQEGISHVDREGNLWSGNLKNWIQYRKTVKGECYTK